MSRAKLDRNVVRKREEKQILSFFFHMFWVVRVRFIIFKIEFTCYIQTQNLCFSTNFPSLLRTMLFGFLNCRKWLSGEKLREKYFKAKWFKCLCLWIGLDLWKSEQKKSEVRKSSKETFIVNFFTIWYVNIIICIRKERKKVSIISISRLRVLRSIM